MKITKRLIIVLGISIMLLLIMIFVWNKNQSELKNDSGINFSEDISTGNIRLLTFGLPDFELQPKYDSLANTFGFKIDNLGCMATEEDIAFADNYNLKVIDYLTPRNGKDWYEKYQKEITVIELVQGLPFAENLVRKALEVEERAHLVDSLSNSKRHLSFVTIIQDTANELYWVKVFEDNGVSLTTHFIYQVEIKTNHIKKIN